jgi:hypothetical protein
MAVMAEKAGVSADRPALTEIESRFLSFALAHAVGPDREASARCGRFAALPGAAAPDLIGAIDIAYAAFILGVLDRLTDTEGRARWIDYILSFQGDDGWFRMADRQRHNAEHSTAYALGALQILSGNRGTAIPRLKPFRALAAQIEKAPGVNRAPFALNALDRLHFWRGSHRAAGIAAIVGAVHELGLPTRELLGIEDPEGWLRGWWDYFAARTSSDGYWRFGPVPVQAAFNALYRRRHDPRLGTMGGAAHLYWIAERLGAPFPHAAAMIESTAGLVRPTGLYEDEPYCLDLDGNFLIARALRQLPGADARIGIAHRALAANRDAVVQWFLVRPPERWNGRSHVLPGAFAAVAEADLVLDGVAQWRDVFEVAWWL